MQEFVPKILELVTSYWDAELHIAGLRLLNGLPLPDHTHPLLRRAMPALMEIVQTGSSLAQVGKHVFLLAQLLFLLHLQCPSWGEEKLGAPSASFPPLNVLTGREGRHRWCSQGGHSCS